MPDVTVSANVDTLLKAANYAAIRAVLGYGTMATQAADAVAITGGTIEGVASIDDARSIADEALSNISAHEALTNNPHVVTAAQASAVATSQLSQTGGASKVPQFDASGNLTTGAAANGSPSFGTAGVIKIPDNQGLLFMGQAGETLAYIINNGTHSGGAEIQIVAPRVYLEGTLQLGKAATARDGDFTYFRATSASAGDTLRESRGVSFQSHTYTTGADLPNDFVAQAVPLDTTGTNSVLKLIANATINGSTGVWTGTDSLWLKASGPVVPTGRTLILPTSTSVTTPAISIGSNNGINISTTIDFVTNGVLRGTLTNGGTLDFSATQGKFVLLLNANGTAANPAYAFINSGGMGMYRSATDDLRFSTGSTDRMRITNSGVITGAGTAVKNIRHGISGAMVLGSVTVTDTGCTADTRYFFSAHTLGTISIPGGYYASTRTASTSFVIQSSQATETSTIDWVAFEP